MLFSPENKKKHDRERGFTLIELLVVLVILGLLVGIAAPAAMRYLSRAKVDVAQVQIKGFAVALDLYRLDVGRYPTSEEGLTALVRQPAGANRWNGPYLKANAVPLDPWERAYVYEAQGGGSTYVLLSLGADGARGGEGENADIAVR